MKLLKFPQLRVNNINLALHQIVVRQGKGDKDRRTMLSQAVVPDLRHHLIRVQELHERDRARGLGWVELPEALVRKFPQAEYDWAWQWGFPSAQLSRQPGMGRLGRHHAHEGSLRRAITEEVRKDGLKHTVHEPNVSPKFCHPFAERRLRQPFRAGTVGA